MSMKKFNSLESLVAELGGKRVIRRVLMANNGIAALKGIRSMRQWAYEMLGDEGAVQFVCMATPEDIGVNVEYIKLADETVEVPGGKNVNNYANVDVIVDIAVRYNCDAVWAGWGHASENPELPSRLKAANITFLGPSAEPMAALGDKIASSIVAQTAKVPTIAWSGSGLTCPTGFDVPAGLFREACVQSAEECYETCKKLGFPLMIKASEGGGGKGIRMVADAAEVENAYHAVAGEVVGSPIFVMKLATDVRHLEVQLLADEYGKCIALRTRDCSVQRRHQKIIEEGPVVNTVPGVLESMEKAAVRLAEVVGYRSVGTVEYLYHKETGMFYFLELNPRLQVEHTVTELITEVNLPACMLCVGMGIPLHRIPDIRSYYERERFGTEAIDFETSAPKKPRTHTIACRITAENPDDGFTPTSGKIDEITFRNSKNSWGYFSVSSHGGVHEFADSQFGHLFSTAPTREEAIAGMVLALKQLTIRGEIRTTKEYLLKLLDMPAFKGSDISTSWLDGLIKQKLRVEPPNPFLSVLCAAAFKATERYDANRAKYLSFLEAGHVPSGELSSTRTSLALVLEGVKYEVVCSKASDSEWVVTLNGAHTRIGFRRLADHGLLLTLADGRSPVVYAEEDANCMRVNIDGRTATFTHEVDPTQLRSQMPGKLVRYLVQDGDHVDANQPFCEIEVMKMYLQLKASIPGKITLKGMPGTTITAGKVLATIDPDDADNIVSIAVCKQAWPENLMAAAEVSGVRAAVTACHNLISGYELPKDMFERGVASVEAGLAAAGDAKFALSSLPLPWLQEGLSAEQVKDLDAPEEAAGERRVLRVLTQLLQTFLAVETLYEGGKLQGEVIDGLRTERAGKLEEVFDINLAHSGVLRYRIIAKVLQVCEKTKAAGSMRALLQRISGLSSQKASMVVFTARHLLRKIDLPCPESRKAELEAALQGAKSDAKAMRALADAQTYGINEISSFLMSDACEHVPIAVELLLRRTYAGVFEMSNLATERLGNAAKTWFASWTLMQMSNKNPLKHGGITGVASHDEIDELEASAAGMRCPGLLGVFDSAEDCLQGLGAVLQRCPTCSSDKILDVVIRAGAEKATAAAFQNVVAEYKRMFLSAGINRVTFLVVAEGQHPLYFTFRRVTDFKEDTTYRNVAPSLAHMLELQKLRNYNIELYQGNPVSNVQVYVCKEKAGLRAKAMATKPRLFVRTLVLPSDLATTTTAESGLTQLTMYDAERVMANCINALEIATSDRSLEPATANHVFIAFHGLEADYAGIESVCKKIMTVHASSLFRLGISEVEIKVFCKLPGSDQAVLLRLFVSNPTTHSLNVECYVEIEGDAQGKSVLVHVAPDGTLAEDGEQSPENAKAADAFAVTVGTLDAPTPVGRNGVAAAWEEGSQGTADSLRSPAAARFKIRTDAGQNVTEHGSRKALHWHRQSPLSAYPILSTFQLRRLLAVQNGTVYVYDWVALFEQNVKEAWAATIAGRPDLAGLEAAYAATQPLVAQELVYDAGVLKSTVRAPGENRVGMVGWKWTLSHPSHFDAKTGKVVPRTIYVVANDITVMSGSFSTAEDELYAAIARASRIEGYPLVYLSANSGARIGLDPELKQLFKVQPSTDPNKLFEYLYLDEATKAKLAEKKAEVCHTERVETADGEVHHKLTAVVGAQWGLGVENLSGSGMIAGEMAHCYDQTPTISVATGRTVGIGAYLVRLGRRVVQVKGSPILLTGNNALNKLLGKEVYSSNNQLGGVNIMGPNGVSHWVANHNKHAVVQVMKWLDYLPDQSMLVNPLARPATNRHSATADPVDRDVVLSVEKSTPYDVRSIIAGQEGSEGLFDNGSFQEAQSEWAKTVVVGRAKLGGMPMGVIGVETRALNKFNPADPADPSSISTMSTQAGQVWYPDSARKTADFLADLHREGLPVVILANWRGFSGGMRDMYDEVLKFGADIVQNLTHYTQPITVYIPPHGELRGGAWVVIDPTINKTCIEMFADDTARGGVLEPSGIIEIKYREREIHATMDRLDPECHRLSLQLKGAEGQLKEYLGQRIKERYDTLMPRYKAVAIEFADLHDRPGRMLAVKSIDGVVSWKDSRRFLYARMKRRVLEFFVRKHLGAAGVEEADVDGVVAGWFAEYAAGNSIADGAAAGRPAVEAAPGTPQTYAGATDDQKWQFFEAIEGPEFAKALAKVKLEAAAAKIVKQLSADPALAAAIKAQMGA
eukprot:TRINITY_DN480_c0_g1_i10.p1 TRINITY_DN480_c0_g1~~TRINITY_DN480_c0_g1_i10.p1  ORF type:complete len:2208 (+),score=1258.07 TRINITY_DN480_c0_g1_i10:92-6715(+)